MSVEERLATIRAEAEALGIEVDEIVSDAEVEEAASLRNRLQRIGEEANAAVGEIPPPCEHEEHDHGSVGGESAPGSMRAWDAPDSLEDFERLVPRRRDLAWCFVHTKDPDDPEVGELLLSLPFPLGDPDPIEFRDVEPRDDGVYGAFVFGGNPSVPDDPPGDRVRYNQFYAVGHHRDPGHHGWLKIWRAAVVNHGHRVQINDRSFPEGTATKVQGTHPYPYEEDVSVPPILRDHPGGIVTLTHQRGFDPDARDGQGGRGLARQALMRYRVPAVAKGFFLNVKGGDYREIPEVGIFYQRNGIFAAVRPDFEADDNPDGVFARLIFTSLHHAYELHVEPE